ncbi:hypothetical protein CRE_15008 [Caenorhabditis remanei]|uniref:Uncharacterized protein n=1 Tax=Caenorhabditis remanei TaxID=31234 RepID=E3NIQ9_CAERE|nr:hypothetical protein CRE_15008 [Caenorhabditis remanei]
MSAETGFFSALHLLAIFDLYLCFPYIKYMRQSEFTEALSRVADLLFKQSFEKRDEEQKRCQAEIGCTSKRFSSKIVLVLRERKEFLDKRSRLFFCALRGGGSGQTVHPQLSIDGSLLDGDSVAKPTPWTPELIGFYADVVSKKY